MISAISYFGMNGYTINLPLNDTQWYDMIIEKDCHFYTVQCKFTDSKDNKISFRSCGGTNGRVYDNILEHPLDLLFCANNEHLMFRRIKNKKPLNLYAAQRDDEACTNREVFKRCL